MASVIVFYFSSNINELPFAETSYNDSYKRLVFLAKSDDLDIRFVFGKKNYKKGKFLSYWKFEDDTLIFNEAVFNADLVCPQTREHPEFEKRINGPVLEVIARDKYLTAKTFPDFVKKTVLITGEGLKELENLKGNLLVIKPRYGALGENIQVLNKEGYRRDSYPGNDYIAQELINSDEGIPGIIKSRHELRLFIFNGVTKAGYLRIPAKNSYLSNISQGATEKQIDISSLPESITELKNIIDNKFININPRLYTIDVMFENGEPWVVELNDMPGMPDISVQPLTDDFLRAMLDMFDQSV